MAMNAVFASALSSVWIFFFFFQTFETGEYFVSLKGFKIPHKSANKVAPFDVNNPPPPGTGDDEALNKLSDSYESPLATDKRPAPPTFEKPIQNAAAASPHTKPTNSSAQKPTKRSALFSKIFYATCFFAFALYTLLLRFSLKHTHYGHLMTRPFAFFVLTVMPTAEGLPEELIKLFKPLCCDLCAAKLNSPSTARLHYESKNHEKKINNWLATWAEKTGEPVPKRPSVCT